MEAVGFTVENVVLQITFVNRLPLASRIINEGGGVVELESIIPERSQLLHSKISNDAGMLSNWPEKRGQLEHFQILFGRAFKSIPTPLPLNGNDRAPVLSKTSRLSHRTILM